MERRHDLDSPEEARSGIFPKLLELTMASAASLGAVFLGSGRTLPWPGNSSQIRFIFVLAVILAGLMIYRWILESRHRKDTAEARRKAEADLNRAKDQFIANVSHGLRTPLTGIVGFASLLKGSVANRDDREAVDLILAESAELSRIVDDLLMAARLDAGVLEIQSRDVRVVAQVRQALDFMDLLGAPVHVDCEDALVRVDPERFGQVLRNLLVNAHRHGRPQVAVVGQVRNGRYICHVIDHGPGIPGELQNKLFTRFAYRPNGEVSGYVGLGLSVVQELCALMDTQVSYRRVRGETHFVLSLPLAQEAEEAGPGEAPRERLVRMPERLERVRDRLVRVPA